MHESKMYTHAQNPLSIPHTTIHVPDTVHVSKPSTNMSTYAHIDKINMSNHLTQEGLIYIHASIILQSLQINQYLLTISLVPKSSSFLNIQLSKLMHMSKK